MKIAPTIKQIIPFFSPIEPIGEKMDLCEVIPACSIVGSIVVALTFARPWVNISAGYIKEKYGKQIRRLFGDCWVMFMVIVLK